MPSPFPGMDPYLETPLYWSDFHHELISAIRASIRAGLPNGFVARVEERLYILEATIRPDVVVLRRPQSGLPTAGTAVLDRALAIEPRIDAPLHVRAYPDAIREAFIEIVAVNEPGRVITTVEVLSPANKRPGAGREEYRRKQADVLASDTNLLEIDLLRGGTFTVSAPLATLHEMRADWNYMVCLHRAGWSQEYDTWPFRVSQRLPRISVPLNREHPDIPLDLQGAFDRAVEAGGYELTIDYTLPPEPRLNAEDAAWADALLREKGLRL
jgi:hypothetical protein